MTIYLITSSTGFPNGTAAANRIKMIGLSLVEFGSKLKVYTNSVEDNKLNLITTGFVEGIGFTYLHNTVKLDVSKLQKVILYCKGLLNLNKILRKLNSKESIIYLYAQGEFFNLLTVILCKFYKLKVVQEINEWHSEHRFFYEKYIRDNIMVKYSDGAVVISKEIERKVKEIKREFKTLTVPVLQSPNLKFNFVETDKPYCFWMGLIDGYLKDIIFIIEGCGTAYMNNRIEFEIILSGPYSQSSKNLIYKTADRVTFPKENIKLLGYTDEKILNQYCGNAFFYIVPMWNDQRSNSRFPTKLASFMFIGKPVITAKVGEVGDILQNEVNVLFYNCGDKEDLAKNIVKLFKDSVLYKRLSLNSKKFANETFNYKLYGSKLDVFFNSILE